MKIIFTLSILIGISSLSFSQDQPERKERKNPQSVDDMGYAIFDAVKYMDADQLNVLMIKEADFKAVVDSSGVEDADKEYVATMMAANWKKEKQTKMCRKKFDELNEIISENDWRPGMSMVETNWSAEDLGIENLMIYNLEVTVKIGGKKQTLVSDCIKTPEGWRILGNFNSDMLK